MPAEGEDDRRSDVSEARRRNTYTSREDDDPLTELLDDDDDKALDEIEQDALIERLKADHLKSDRRAHELIEAGIVAGASLDIASLLIAIAFRTSSQRPDSALTYLLAFWRSAWYLVLLLVTPQGHVGRWIRSRITKPPTSLHSDSPGASSAGSPPRVGPSDQQLGMLLFSSTAMLFVALWQRQPISPLDDGPRLLLAVLPVLLAFAMWAQTHEERQGQSRLEGLAGLKYHLKGA